MTSRKELRVVELDDGRSLAFAEFGDPAGLPVFGFHGTPGSHGQLANFDQPGKATGVRVIAVDRPGYGLSTYDANRKLIDWPADVMAIADHVGVERFGVVGISGGGPHAMVCAHALAPRLTGCVSVAGVGSLQEPSDAEGMMPFNRGLAWLGRRAPFALTVPMAAMGLVARLMPTDKVIEQMKAELPPADIEVMERPGVAEELMGDMAEKHPTRAKASAQDFALFAKPWGFRVQDIAVPVQIWHGDADVNVPLQHSQRYAREIPNCTLHVMPNLGHMLAYDLGAEILSAAAGLAPAAA